MTDLQTQTLLVELGTEELPPKALKNLSDSFASNVADELSKLGFTFSSVNVFGAPRRLGVALAQCERKQADKVVEKRGPAVSVAFDENGQATKAALGWARGNGIEIDQALRLKTDKGEWLLHKANEPGLLLDDCLQGVLERSIKRLPIPKPMRWGSSSAEFIRPAHTLCVMYGEQVIDLQLLGISSGRELSGHRFHGDHRFELNHADAYAKALHEQYVVADYATRMQNIQQQLLREADKLGLTADFDAALLEEISSLVEWPVVLVAEFEPSFLEVPKEALIYTMKDDQKYVPLLDSKGQLSSSFLFVSNIESKDPAQVIAGNERVIRPRLSDAKFFFDTDKKITQQQRASKLSGILFQKELGTLAEKTERVAEITQILGKQLDVSQQELEHARRAAQLAKADLMSNMVMEFPSVQGTMGYYYALNDGEDEQVALAIKEQYLPRFAGDALPQSKVGMLLSLAEKLDTLVGIFGINKLPKGDKDPFALRRSAIGVLRILVSFKANVELSQLISQVAALFNDKLSNQNVSSQVCEFLIDRMKPFYADPSNGAIGADVVSSVMLSAKHSNLSDLHQRISAVATFAQSDSAESLINANKRVANILSKNNIDVAGKFDIDTALFDASEEKALYEKLVAVRSEIGSFGANNVNYDQLLKTLSEFKAPLDAFFDKVMIMADDEAVKQNRIALIANIRQMFLSVADISVINV